MTDTLTTDEASTDTQGSEGQGKHRGRLSGQDSEAAPRGRHRKPEPAETAA